MGNIVTSGCMNEVGLVKFTFKKEGRDTWIDWCNELISRKEEVLETLESEGVLVEACFLSRKEQCIYYFIEAVSFERMQEVAKNSTRFIDIEHRAVKLESIEFVERMELLFHFDIKD